MSMKMEEEFKRWTAKRKSALVQETENVPKSLHITTSGGLSKFLILLEDFFKKMVGVRGFEPPASASRTQRSTRLSHTPTRVLIGMTITAEFCVNFN